MEKVETKITQIEDKVHHFYCDECGIQNMRRIIERNGWREVK